MLVQCVDCGNVDDVTSVAGINHNADYGEAVIGCGECGGIMVVVEKEE